MPEAFYINSKNESIVLTITKHAKDRFTQRWPAVFPFQKLPLDINQTIIKFFNEAVRHQNFSPKEKTRLRRYGKDTLFFRNNPFTFVVKDTKIITAELNQKDLRCFNKRSSTAISNHFKEKTTKSSTTAPEKPKLLRLVANTVDKDGLPKFLNLGSYPLQEEYISAERLNENSGLITHLKIKLTEKFKQKSQLIEILGSYGKKDMNKFCIYDQLQIKKIFSDHIGS